MKFDAFRKGKVRNGRFGEAERSVGRKVVLTDRLILTELAFGRGEIGSRPR